MKLSILFIMINEYVVFLWPLPTQVNPTYSCRTKWTYSECWTTESDIITSIKWPFWFQVRCLPQMRKALGSKPNWGTSKNLHIDILTTDPPGVWLSWKNVEICQCSVSIMWLVGCTNRATPPNPLSGFWVMACKSQKNRKIGHFWPYDLDFWPLTFTPILAHN